MDAFEANVLRMLLSVLEKYDYNSYLSLCKNASLEHVWGAISHGILNDKDIYEKIKFLVEKCDFAFEELKLLFSECEIFNYLQRFAFEDSLQERICICNGCAC